MSKIQKIEGVSVIESDIILYIVVCLSIMLWVVLSALSYIGIVKCRH